MTQKTIGEHDVVQRGGIAWIKLVRFCEVAQSLIIELAEVEPNGEKARGRAKQKEEDEDQDEEREDEDKALRKLSPEQLPATWELVPAKGLVTRDPKFYQETIDALSMRNFVPGTGTGETNGHDHTFATFPRFGAVAAAHLGDMLAATRRIAAADHVQYIEQISDPSAAFSPPIMTFAGNPDDFEKSSATLAPRLPELVAQARAQYDSAETAMRRALRSRLSCLACALRSRASAALRGSPVASPPTVCQRSTAAHGPMIQAGQ